MEAVEGRKKRESKEEDEDERRKGGRRGGSKPQYLGASCIRITKVKVPAAVEIGGAAELDCEWEREGDTMYSIKWYQGSTEFYRYTPSAQKQIQIFEPTTLDVDRARSSGGSVRVANITVEAEGPFHCEVSAEGPTFHTASDSAKMWVVALPNQGPIVNGVKGHYQVRDWVDLTCISPRSRPAPRLTFTINGSPKGGWRNRRQQEEGRAEVYPLYGFASLSYRAFCRRDAPWSPALPRYPNCGRGKRRSPSALDLPTRPPSGVLLTEAVLVVVVVVMEVLVPSSSSSFSSSSSSFLNDIS
ncbi:uncharacterized protein LOC123519905 isoform X4 [Portunus trituberculatus]|uniref:uncharacterized protein LOC123519905 isoform X4 n=1 Tax=Portunus trituberculatus TaxID=210409 RepID=UPI001E1CDE7D|nr:uncharacterized protein LOC123519905 isoform X4 [Portunus trituberculatus]